MRNKSQSVKKGFQGFLFIKKEKIGWKLGKNLMVQGNETSRSRIKMEKREKDWIARNEIDKWTDKMVGWWHLIFEEMKPQCDFSSREPSRRQELSASRPSPPTPGVESWLKKCFYKTLSLSLSLTRRVGAEKEKMAGKKRPCNGFVTIILIVAIFNIDIVNIVWKEGKKFVL